ncbi:MAG: helix-turn-helix domain-containing protein [Methylophilaceae bacterium]
MSTKVGEKIRQIRECLKIERTEFSQMTGIPRDTLVSVEIGRREPGAGILIAVAEQWPEYATYLLTDKIEVIQKKPEISGLNIKN